MVFTCFLSTHILYFIYVLTVFLFSIYPHLYFKWHLPAQHFTPCLSTSSTLYGMYLPRMMLPTHTAAWHARASCGWCATTIVAMSGLMLQTVLDSHYHGGDGIAEHVEKYTRPVNSPASGRRILWFDLHSRPPASTLWFSRIQQKMSFLPKKSYLSSSFSYWAMDF